MERPHGVDPAIFKLSEKFSSVTLLGPPMSDKLIKLIQHVFTPEEAAVAVHLPGYVGKTAEIIARKARRSLDEVQPLLDSMSKKRVIWRSAKDGKVSYAVLPIVPGMFELALMSGGDDPWYRKYAQLFEELVATGYMAEMSKPNLPSVRNIPIEANLPAESRVFDADRFSNMVDSHTKMGIITVCQCRHSHKLIDQKCKRSRPEDGCFVFGDLTDMITQEGVGRMVSREEMKDAAAERFEKKLLFMTGNVRFNNQNAICTCCDCCCEGLRIVNEFGAMGFIAAPHFIAKVDNSLCNDCGRCPKVCNTKAQTMREKKHYFNSTRCVGCGYCVAECKQKAISLVANPAYRPPSDNFLNLSLKMLPKATLLTIKRRLDRGL